MIGPDAARCPVCGDTREPVLRGDGLVCHGGLWWHYSCTLVLARRAVKSDCPVDIVNRSTRNLDGDAMCAALDWLRERGRI